VGALLRVLGSREADETNYYHLKNKTMSGGILYVFGGRVPTGVKERLEARLVNELQGSKNTSRILVVEAMPVGSSPNERTVLPQMQFQSLRDANTTDAMFSKYDAEAADAIGATFRQSPLLRGRTPSDLNRATAEAALHFTEQQVYQPEREAFDWMVNKFLMPEIGVRLLRFRSNSAPARSLSEVTDLLKVVAPAGLMVPEEMRTLIGDVLNTPLERIEDAWARWPMPMTLAGITAPDSAGAPPDELAQVSADMEKVKATVSSIVADELRLAGVAADVQAGWMPR
jgi:capsid portal protein